ncbi:DUF2304 domain-containing protein, partial [Candidatus Woesearchaeota archaeon]|nr:DUF2304 domain-containing protein [Candidatus Woesearchaeota archaeon]
MVLGIQVFGIVFGAFMLYMSFLQWKKRQFTLTEWVFWSFFAVLFSAISAFPDIINPLLPRLKLERKLDLLIILGFMFLIAATFYSYRIVRHTQKQVEELVRQIAIERAQQPDLFNKNPSRARHDWAQSPK